MWYCDYDSQTHTPCTLFPSWLACLLFPSVECTCAGRLPALPDESRQGTRESRSRGGRLGQWRLCSSPPYGGGWKNGDGGGLMMNARVENWWDEKGTDEEGTVTTIIATFWATPAPRLATLAAKPWNNQKLLLVCNPFTHLFYYMLFHFTCSSTFGSTVSAYMVASTPSNWDRRTKLVPTKIRKSWRSFSRRFLSLAPPWD